MYEFDSQTTTEAVPQKYVLVMYGLIALLVILGAGYFGNNFYNAPPNNFPVATDIEITDGMTVREIADSLEEHAVVKSALYLYAILLKKYDGTYVQAGTYTFERPLTAIEVASAITTGDHLSPALTITLPEGFRARDIHSFLPDNFEPIPLASFEEKEGYLFPETYFISPDMSALELKELLVTTATERHSEIISTVSTTTALSFEEIVILASLIEREAGDAQSKKMVSGILQNRLSVGMPLQVDAVFDYLLDKESSELTVDDLLIDSPFNTYTNRGLPPSPISNPGEESIRAVLEPTKSNYFYYLTSSDGTFHYAKTFEEHKQNKAKYLP